LSSGLVAGSAPAGHTGTGTGQAFTKGIGDQSKNAGLAAFGVGSNAMLNLGKPDPTPTGANHGQRFIGGIDSKRVAAGVSGAAIASTAIAEAAKKDGRPAGQAMVTGFINGAIAAQNRLNLALYGVVKDAENWLIPLVGGDAVGAAFDQGIARGINANTGGINQAATTAATNAATAAKAALNVNSPSRLTRDTVGKPFSEGIAVGITDNAHLAITAATAIATASVTASSKVVSTGVKASKVTFPTMPASAALNLAPAQEHLSAAASGMGSLSPGALSSSAAAGAFHAGDMVVHVHVAQTNATADDIAKEFGKVLDQRDERLAHLITARGGSR
jgi:hypothetical protein